MVEGESLLMGINDIAVSSGSGLHFGNARTKLRTQGARRRRRFGALFDPFGIGRSTPKRKSTMLPNKVITAVRKLA